MTDYIKREDALEEINKTLNMFGRDHTITDYDAIDCILTVPSADVVEVDKAQKEIDYWHDKAQSYEQTILKLSLNKADVVEVVRCKDCKWFGKAGCAINIVDDSDRPKETDYCSFGERADT